jgi:hypothetical protein
MKKISYGQSIENLKRGITRKEMRLRRRGQIMIGFLWDT